MKKIPAKKQAKIVKLETDFAGIKAGSILFVATKEILENYILEIPRGEFRKIHRIRNELARKNQCDATCPVSTAIFIRQVADKALKEIESGKDESEVAPFWRVIEYDSKIAKRLAVDSEWIKHRQTLENINST
jgi:hypothetical protein